jgi:hypothetical protein
MTEQAKRSVGRPRKNPKAPAIPQEQFMEWLRMQEGITPNPKQENPDCALATKGWVKRILREISVHDHTHNLSVGITGISVLLGVSTIIVLMSGRFSGTAFANQWFAPVVMFTLGCLVVLSDMIQSNINETCYNHIWGLKQIQKYEPPKCEEKRECE